MSGYGGGTGTALRIWCMADERYCLAVRDGKVVLAPADPSDDHQHWFKDMRFAVRLVRDEEGNPAFSLINKATGLVLARSLDLGVELLQFDPNYLDDAVLWTGGSDGGGGFCFIRTFNDICLKLAASPSDDGATARLWDSDLGDNDSLHWKILPWNENDDSDPPTFRIFCKAFKSCCLSVRDGTVYLVPLDCRDEYQHWVQDTRYGDKIRDLDGNPVFALINKFTGAALRMSQGHATRNALELLEHTIKLVPYDPCRLDISMLWSKRDINMGRGFHGIESVDDIGFKLSASLINQDDRKVHNVVLYNYCGSDNQYWMMVPSCK